MTVRWAVALAAVFAISPRAHAYSDPAQFAAPALEAGGGGRFYSGSPADGYTCETCHAGASRFRATLSGVPERYVPGATYLIRVDWPESVQHGAALFELTDERGRGAGTLALPPRGEFVERELCEPRNPPVLAAVALPADRGRTIVAAADCGEHAIRAQWTAPSTGVGPVWLSGAVLSSNHDGALTGDSVATFSEPITGFGRALPPNELRSACSVALRGTGEIPNGFRLAACVIAFALGLRVRRRTAVRLRTRRNWRQLSLCGWALATALLAVSGCSVDSGTRTASNSVLVARGRAVEPWDGSTRDAESRAFDAESDEPSEDVSPDAAVAHGVKPTRLVFRMATQSQSGRYQPKNVGAIWIEDGQGRGVKTLVLWASLRIRYLPDYLKSNPMRDTTDAVTSATLPTHRMHEVTWNLKGADNQMTPDGMYSVQVEVTDRDAPGQTLSVPFVIGPEASVIKLPDTPYFTNIELRYE